ncbi:hypothetical protein BH23PLA1_BH23PLA1_31550 [soil metagenome]
MSSDRGRGRRPESRSGRRAFRPTLGDRLEDRQLMSTFVPPRLALARQVAGLNLGQRGNVSVFTARGGQSAQIIDTDGERYRVNVFNAGTVRAYPMPGGRVGLLVQGTQENSELEITNVGGTRAPESAHTFVIGPAIGDRRLNIGLIDVASGRIGGIFGFGTATLSGPLVVRGEDPIDRIALADLLPGSRIEVGGDINTLDVLNSVNLGAGDGIFVGRDLNLLNVGQNLILQNGAMLATGRDIGLIGQPAKGTGQGGQGAFVQGDVFIGEGSAIVAGRRIVAPIAVLGNLVGSDRILAFGQERVTFRNAAPFTGASVGVLGVIVPPPPEI